MTELYLTAIDSVNIFADWSRKTGSAKAALLIHGRSKDHVDWQDLHKVLEEKGWSTLAIDLRGHGKSEGPPPDKSRRFDQFDDYHSMMFDVAAAADFVRGQLSPFDAAQGGTSSYSLAIVGSSIGANLAIGYAADHFEVKATALLSPGVSYYGLRGDDYLYQYHRPLAIFTAKDDHTYAEAQKLLKIPGLDKNKLWYQEYETGGHGREILRNHPESIPQLVDWLEKSVVI